VTFDEAADHLGGVGLVVVLDDGGERGELPVAARRGCSKGADALCDEVDSEREFVVLRLEHEVHRLEHRPRDVGREGRCEGVERVGAQVGSENQPSGAI
jgi:hypothetical protein